MENFVDNLLKQLIEKNLVSKEDDHYFVVEDMILPKEYNYQSLALCVLDAVFSIGVKYKIVENVVKRYCDIRKTSLEECNDTMDKFIEFCGGYEKDKIDFDKLADTLCCHNRTSAKNGILKIEACYNVATILRAAGITNIELFRDKTKMTENVENKIKGVQGQGSGIMLSYLYMLANDDGKCKPDRHIKNFLAGAGISDLNNDDIQKLFEETCKRIYQKNQSTNISVRLLDYIIWEYQSQDKTKKQPSCHCKNN